jgi:peptide/nickel transport system permease protein
MSAFVPAYFAALVAGTGLAWYWQQRDGLIALIVLIALSALLALVWGQSAIVGMALMLAAVAGAAACGYVFRALLVAVLPDNAARFMKTAPLTASFGMLTVLVICLLAIFADLIAPFGEREIVGDVWQPSGGEFLLGTDNLGRDMFSRLIFGAQTTIAVALAASVLAFAIGMFLSFTAAVVGGWFDQVASRIEDMLLAIPTLIFALVVLAALPQNMLVLIVVMAIIDQTRVFRLGRAVAIDIAVQDFVEAARLRGERWSWIVFREILPNVLTPLIAEFGLRFSFAVLFLSTLSFLGLGIQPPEADWGGMVKDNKDGIIFLVPAALYPGGAIALLAVCVNMIVDWLLRRTASLRGGRGA